MVQTIGIDFGTTNSLVSVVSAKGKVKAFLENDKPHPSVLMFGYDDVICGASAKKKMGQRDFGVVGNFFRAPKRYLNHDQFDIGGEIKRIEDIIAIYIRFLIDDLVEKDNQNIANQHLAVVTIPVALDGRGREKLRDAFALAGVQVQSFVHEPLAALYAYYRQQGEMQDALRRDEGKYVLVFDWGGGTLDLTLCKIQNNTIYQVFNRGNNHVGGDYLDTRIKNYVEDQHAKKFGWDEQTKKLLLRGKDAELIEACERAKIALSTRDSAAIFVPDCYEGAGDDTEIYCQLTRDVLEDICDDFVKEGIYEITRILAEDQAGLNRHLISFCLATGGMTQMPAIKHRLLEIFGATGLIIPENGDQIISHGAAWIAYDKPTISLAKPFELVEARNSQWPLIEAGRALPSLNQRFDPIRRTLYCADPRDGCANLLFKRPKDLGKNAATDPRVSYSSCLSVPVNSDFPPLKERIQLQLTIDHNYVIHATAWAESEGKMVETQIYDLEFAITACSQASSEEEGGGSKSKRVLGYKEKHSGVVVLSNVTGIENNWAAIPGELLHAYNKANPFHRQELTEQQRIEEVRYQPCSGCGSKWRVGCCTTNANLKTVGNYEHRTT